MFKSAVLLAFVLSAVNGQQVGTNTAEVHPSLPWKRCTVAGGCTTVAGTVALDANWRWTHTTQANTFTNCYTGNTWNATLCPNNLACAQNCALEGANYPSTYGITTNGDALSLKFVTQSSQKNVGSRVYLMADDSHYEGFQLAGREFTFDVDMSTLPCGLNGAVYFSEMPLDGGVSTTNTAGAKYGTGYCDSQCPHDIKFIGGQANVEGWVPSSNSTNSGTGKYGACCAEMDIWEANSIASAYTPHPCTQTGLVKCEGTACGDGDNRYGGICDKDGCDFNSFRQGDRTFLGPGTGFVINTLKKITVVTSFITNDGTTSGTVVEIRRTYVQDGKVVTNSKSTQPAGYDSITTPYCTAQKTLFGDTNSFQSKGGMPGMSGALSRGMVLVLSIWDDYAVNMLWLDSKFPVDGDETKPGVLRGTCATTSGSPPEVEVSAANATVTYSNIRFGEIGSTYSGSTTTTTSGSSSGTSTSTTSTTSTSTSTSSGGCTVPKWGQCGGSNYSGCTTCAAGSTCTVGNPFYSQCL